MTIQSEHSDITNSKTTTILGVKVNAVTLNSTIETILNWIEQNQKQYVAVSNVHCIIEAQDDDRYKKVLNSSGLTVPDGMPLVWLSRLAGQTHVTRVYGPDLMLNLSSVMAKKNYSAFYLGGKPGVANALSKILELRFPGLKTAGTYCPPFKELSSIEEDQIAQMINASGCNILWVGLGAPKQEKFMAKILKKIDQCVMIGVGAAFDFHSGKIRQAPRWMQQAGLEWLFRLCTEPRRLWKRYLVGNPRFLYLLACNKLGLREF